MAAFLSAPVHITQRHVWATGVARCSTRTLPSHHNAGRLHRQARMCETSVSEYQPDVSEELQLAVTDLKGRLKRCTLYLVGPMGSGKSTLGRYLAHLLGFRFLDLDELIELAAQKPISEIFEESGEETFRDLESAVLDQVQAYLSCCVSTGGGIVLRDTNWGSMRTGIIAYLDVPIEVLEKRLEGDTKRPLLRGGTIHERLERIMEERRGRYELADVTVRVEECDALDNVALKVCRSLSNFIKENPPKMAELYAANLQQQKQSGA